MARVCPLAVGTPRVLCLPCTRRAAPSAGALPSSRPARLCVARVAFRYSCVCCREAPGSVFLRRVVVRAKLLTIDIESVTRALDMVKCCVCLCPSPPDRDLALFLASLLAKSFPSPRHKNSFGYGLVKLRSFLAVRSGIGCCRLRHKVRERSMLDSFRCGQFLHVSNPCCLPRMRSLLIHRVLCVLAFVVELLNPSSLARSPPHQLAPDFN
jgi:hypothetical protein